MGLDGVRGRLVPDRGCIVLRGRLVPDGPSLARVEAVAAACAAAFPECGRAPRDMPAKPHITLGQVCCNRRNKTQ